MLYKLLKGGFKAMIQGFYRRVDQSGAMPESGPVLLVSNHANGTLDPLMFATALRRPLRITAKSSLAANAWVRFLMWGMGVVRFDRDKEAGHRQTNQKALARLQAMLAEGEAICLFPEGKSHSKEKMLPFKPGAALLALKAFSRGVDVAIQPAALVYSDKAAFRSGCEIRYGQAFLVSEWKAGHPSAGVDALSLTMRNKIKELMDRKASVIDDTRPDSWSRRLQDWESLLLGLPAAMAGLVLNLPAFWATRRLQLMASKEEDHWASAAVFTGLALFPAWWALLAALVLLFAGPVWAILAGLAPLLGFYSLHYLDHSRLVESRYGSVSKTTKRGGRHERKRMLHPIQPS